MRLEAGGVAVEHRADLGRRRAPALAMNVRGRNQLLQVGSHRGASLSPSA